MPPASPGGSRGSRDAPSIGSSPPWSRPTSALAAAARQRLDSLTKPRGSLGRLEELAVRVVVITGNPLPRVEAPVIFTLAGDHGVAAEGVSAYPQAVTAQMVENFVARRRRR